MKTVHLVTLAAGPGGVWQPGVHDVDDDLAEAWIRAGHAFLPEDVQDLDRKAESAALDPSAEKAARRLDRLRKAREGKA